MNPAMAKLVGDLYRYRPEISIQIEAIVNKMVSLGFIATFKNVEEGPIVRTYYFEPHSMSPLSKIQGHEDDIALSLKVESVIISRELGNITIAVPRPDRQIIKFDAALHKLLTSPEVRKMTLPILMGQTPQGQELYIDLAEQPHLLIAGTTGAGKSIFTSQLICSLALIHDPSALKFTLVDTKQLDLTLFQGLPHIGQVIQDIHGLRSTLMTLLDQVRERTDLMSGMVRNVGEWNRNNPDQKFQYQILVIDEFADVLDSDREYISGLSKKMQPPPIDLLVKRLAQISRAAGVHIVIATQRPSIKVVSGDIKTNFAGRICFKLPSMMDSRVILDENGAEKLLGKGDYLYKTSTSENVKRAHSAFVSINDIATIITQSEELRRQYANQRE
jgi:S-DNA-T family DNA segregation ATPase FtsK/SpoIIIE